VRVDVLTFPCGRHLPPTRTTLAHTAPLRGLELVTYGITLNILLLCKLPPEVVMVT